MKGGIQKSAVYFKTKGGELKKGGELPKVRTQIIGAVTTQVESLLQLQPSQDRNIYFGQSNLDHMKNRHPYDFAKYGSDLCQIIALPDYVGKNPSDDSIEYVKEYPQDSEYVKVAVRLSLSGNRYYARSLYILNDQRVERFIAKGTLKKV